LTLTGGGRRRGHFQQGDFQTQSLLTPRILMLDANSIDFIQKFHNQTRNLAPRWLSNASTLGSNCRLRCHWRYRGGHSPPRRAILPPARSAKRSPRQVEIWATPNPGSRLPPRIQRCPPPISLRGCSARWVHPCTESAMGWVCRWGAGRARNPAVQRLTSSSISPTFSR
jgi:hypothetical protein